MVGNCRIKTFGKVLGVMVEGFNCLVYLPGLPWPIFKLSILTPGIISLSEAEIGAFWFFLYRLNRLVFPPLSSIFANFETTLLVRSFGIGDSFSEKIAALLFPQEKY